MSQRCPKCGERLPRTVNFVSPSHGHQTVASVIAFVSIYGGVFFLVFHKLWPPDLWPWGIGDTPRLALGSAMFGVWLAIDGLLTSTALWWWERHNPPPEPRGSITYSYDTEIPIGDGIRAVTTRDGQRRWLRERGFVIPAEPERGALSRWLWAVHDGKCTLSQTGARTTIRDNQTVRRWANDILTLWCKAEWAEPAMGWNGDEPELGQGVTNVNADVVYRVASGGMGTLIDLLMGVVEENLAPHPQDETAQPTTGLPPTPPTAPTGGGSGEGELYELEPWIDEDIDD